LLNKNNNLYRLFLPQKIKFPGKLEEKDNKQNERKNIMKVIIEVRGGVVVQVYGDDPEIMAEVLDWDNLAHDATDADRAEIARIEKEKQGFHELW